jgi:hypothetical protein
MEVIGHLHSLAVPWYLLTKKLGGLQSWSGYFGGGKRILLSFPGIKPLIVYLIV